MSKVSFRQIAVALATVATITINALANILPINGQQTGAISDRFAVYFVPAGYVFSIWGLIYMALIAYTVYQFLPASRNNPLVQSIGWLYVASAAANNTWIFLWHYNQFVWTLVAMLSLLGLLVAIYLRLAQSSTGFRSWGERLFVQIPFSIYLGWITVATIANVTDVLSYLNWGGWGIAPQVWALVLLAVATLIAGVMAITRRDVAYLLVLVWAFAGIGVKQAGAPLVANAAWAATAAVGLFALLAALRRPRIEIFERVGNPQG